MKDDVLVHGIWRKTILKLGENQVTLIIDGNEDSINSCKSLTKSSTKVSDVVGYGEN